MKFIILWHISIFWKLYQKIERYFICLMLKNNKKLLKFHNSYLNSFGKVIIINIYINILIKQKKEKIGAITITRKIYIYL